MHGEIKVTKGDKVTDGLGLELGARRTASWLIQRAEFSQKTAGVSQ